MNFLKRIFADRNRPERQNWWRHYGRYADPVASVWLDRDLEHRRKQVVRDASQNVMTRLV